MQLTVLLFGPQATLAGARSIDVSVSSDTPTAGEVLTALGDAAPALVGSLAISRLAINHEFALSTQKISPSDEVALIGMVSGG